MTQNQSYPSPNAAQIGGAAGPFFGQNGGLSPPNMSTEIQLSAELSRAAQPVMASDANAARDNGDAGQQLQHHPTIRHESSPQQVAQGVMSLGEHPHPEFSTPHDPGSSSRKRSKVSRACDECRRKKIRCDASTDNVTEPCSSCRRTNISCQFSRQPMKRGPSKGYIKELADKLTRLEESIAPRHLQYQQNSQPADLSYIHGLPDSALTQLQEFATSTATPLTRKRTISVSDESHEQYGAPQRSTLSGWPSHETSRNLPHTPSGLADYSTNAHGSLMRNVLGTTAGTNPQSSPENAFQMTKNARDFVGTADLDSTAALVEWDEAVVNEHYRLIQPTLPFLPFSKQRLRSRLGVCSPALRDAFLIALACAVRSNPSSALGSDGTSQQRMKQVYEIITVFQYEYGGSKSTMENLVYLQILILIILKIDNLGPLATRPDTGPPRAEWLGRAVGMITHLKLNSMPSREKLVTGDEDTDDRLGRRLYWSVFMLDRWHAAGTSGLFQLPEHYSVLVAEDETALGDVPYQLARISFIVGHLATIFATVSNSTVDDDIFGSRNPALHLLAISVQGELDRFRESVDKLIGHATTVQLAYWHARLLVVCLHPSSSPQDLVLPVQRICALMNQSSSASFTPLSHHYGLLAAVTLAELVGLPETREEAFQGIDELEAAIANLKAEPSASTAGRGSEENWQSAVLDLLERKKAQANNDGQGPILGLQHLANAAVGERNGDDGAMSGAGMNGAVSTSTTAMQSSSSATVSAAAAAAAAATAVAAQQRMQEFDMMALARQGYLTAFIKETVLAR